MNDSTSDPTANFSSIERISADGGQLTDYYTEIFNYSGVHAGFFSLIFFYIYIYL